MHDGAACRPADGRPIEAPTQSSRLVELINSPSTAKPAVDELADGRTSEFGTYLQGESISTALADT